MGYIPSPQPAAECQRLPPSLCIAKECERMPRCRWEIVLDVLETATTEVKTTDFLYEDRMSHEQWKGYMKEMVEKGLVEIKIGERKRTYLLTEKGRKVLRQLKKVKRLLK
jgi:predicted transcriptional regulator